jgi:hypothetical protein
LINAEYHTVFFATLTLLILHLLCCFNDIIHGLCGWLLFFFDFNDIFGIAEFTFPNLLFISFWTFTFLDFTAVVKAGLAVLANDRVSGGKLSLVSQCRKFDFKDIRIDFLSV